MNKYAAHNTAVHTKGNSRNNNKNCNRRKMKCPELRPIKRRNDDDDIAAELAAGVAFNAM